MICLIALTSLLFLWVTTVGSLPPADPDPGSRAAGKRPAPDSSPPTAKRPKSDAYTQATVAYYQEWSVQKPQSVFVQPSDLASYGWTMNNRQSDDKMDISSVAGCLHDLGLSTDRNDYVWKQAVYVGNGPSEVEDLSAYDVNTLYEPYRATYTVRLDVKHGILIVDTINSPADGGLETDLELVDHFLSYGIGGTWPILSGRKPVHSKGSRLAP